MIPSPFASVPFVHPGIAGAALLTAFIPILIHLINRRRYRRIPWAAMTFLLAANRRSSRRMRLEQWILMLLRIAVIVLLGLAVARPYLPASAILPTSFSRVHRIIVVDNSLSMSAKNTEGRARFAAAQECATGLVASFPQTDAVSLVTMSAPAEAVIAQPAYDRRWARESVSALKPTQSPTDAVGAVTAVMQILQESPAAVGNRVIYIISDFTRHDWESSTPQTPTDAVRAIQQLADALPDPSTDLYLIVIENVANDNIAVTRLRPESSLIGVGTPMRVLTEVTNFGATTVRNLGLQIHRDGLIVRREVIGALSPGASAVSIATTEFAGPGTHAIEARLTSGTGNALMVDDARSLSVEAREKRPVLLVDGRPGMKLLDGQAGFLATALAPDAGADSEVRTSEAFRSPRAKVVHLFAPKVIDETEFENEILSNYDAVGLCNVARLSVSQWERLRRFASQGGGVMFVLGELVGGDHYNRFGHSQGAGLLPGKVGRPLVDHGDEGASFKLEGQPHSIVTDFAGHTASGLFRARVSGYVPFEVDRERCEVVLRYSTDDPALVASTFGKGRVLVWTTSVNMDWTNLPAKGDFVGLVHNAFAYLVPQHGEHRNLRVGEKVIEPLTPVESTSALRVTEDDGTVHEPSLASRDEALALEYGPVNRAQLLNLTIGSQTRAVAVNVDPAESNLAAMDGPALGTVIARPVRIWTDIEANSDQPSAARTTELASFALYAVLAFLLGELWVAMRFGAPRDANGSKHIERGPVSYSKEAKVGP